MQLQLRAEIKQVRAGKGQHKAEMGKFGQKRHANLSPCWPIYACVDPFGHKLIHSSPKLIDSGPEWTHIGYRLTHLSLFTLLSSKSTSLGPKFINLSQSLLF